MQTNNLGKVAVLYGGISAEREVSLKSGAAVLAALQRCGVDAEGIDVNVDIISHLSSNAYDHAFIVLHGRGGEDGVIQSVLEMLEIPYTGSGVMASALGMDKLRSKLVWLGLGLPTPAFYSESLLNVDSIVSQLGLPVMVKPAHEGSSLGVAKVTSIDNLQTAWQDAKQYDDQILVEQWIEGTEYTIAILDGEALPVIALETPNVFYDYEAKYEADNTHYICPCGLSEAQEKQLQMLALKAFNGLGAEGWGRVDLFLDKQAQPWLIEINTVPGMTSHSLVPMAAKAAGLSFDDLVYRILMTAAR